MNQKNRIYPQSSKVFRQEFIAIFKHQVPVKDGWHERLEAKDFHGPDRAPAGRGIAEESGLNAEA